MRYMHQPPPHHHHHHHDIPFVPGGPRGRGRRRPFGGGRGRARRGDVRHALLLLLAEEPRNGYGLMQEIEARSQGRWRPSPGSVYPSLAQLEDQGYVRSSESDGGKLFEITDEGRRHLEEHPQAAPPWENEGGPEDDLLVNLRELAHGVVIATRQVAQSADVEQLRQACELLDGTRRGLYRILAEEPGGER